MKKKRMFYAHAIVIGFVQKIGLKMKLTLLLVLTGFLNLMASESYSQLAKLTISLKNVTVEQVLAEIEEGSEFNFVYNRDAIDLERKVDVNYREVKVYNILDDLFKNTNVTYHLVDKIIVLSTISPVETTNAQQINIFGKVTDSGGQPLPGVTVIVKGTTNGTVTNVDGQYSLNRIPADAILSFSFVGMKTKEIPVDGKSSIDVMMEEEAIGLEEVVAIGYGTMKKKDLTGSVSSVQGDELTKVSAPSLSSAISGRLPGVQVAGTTIRMRGVGSVYSGVDPLIIIDGFEGNLTQVVPNDVESVTVLKDAASSSIYGARAANGVILVTTKKGHMNQPLKLEVTARYGVQQSTKIPGILDSQEWCYKMNESTMARSGIEYWVDDQAPELQTTDTNWLDYIFQTVPIQDYHVSATGGTNKLRYSVNLGYHDHDWIFINNSFRRVSVRSNVDYISDRFSAGASVYQFRSWNSVNNTDSSDAMILSFITPSTIPIYNSDGLPGTPRSGYSGEDVLQNNTPSMAAIARQYELTQNSSTINLYAEQQLLKGLKFKTVFNMRTTDNYEQTFNPEWYTYRPDDTEHTTVYKGNSLSELECEDYTNFFWEWQNLLTYTKDFGKHHIDVLAGYSAQKSESASIYAYISDLPRNSVVSLTAGGGDPDVAGSTGSSSLQSQFGRINYSYVGKYLAQFNIRRDGSSVFAPENRWGIFPSFSFGWRVSEEEFLKNSPVISNMKLRAGIGSLGNSSIPSYEWLSTIGFSSGYVFGENQEYNSGASISGAYNEDISWEKTTTTNIGIDLGLYQNRANVSFEIFKRKTTDMLLLLPLPTTTGYSSDPYVNIGGVDNRGWEITAEYNNHLNEFKYSLSFNITHVKNEVVDMGGVSPIIDNYSRTEEGQAISSFYGYVVEGIYQSEEDIANNPSFDGAQPGDFKYKNIDDSDDEITADDRTFLGNAIPQFFYGANINLSWKAFDLSMQLQGEFKKKMMVTPEFGMDFGSLYDYANMYKEVYENRWTQEGDNTYYPALGSGIRGMNNACNTRWLQDVGYMRIKNLEIGYTVPKRIYSRLPINNIRVFFSGTNLLTFTDYVGFDPEMGGRQKRSDSSGYMDKVYTRGGTDSPQARVIQIGANVTF